MIDPAQIPFWEQVETFARASHVVAVHGAALTNLIFRKNAPLSLLEIAPGQLPLPYYFYLCRKYGFEYRLMIGDSAESYPWRSPFRVDADALAAHIEDMLESSGG
jgi:capsular polysaccharide biosynthesis protein